VANEIVIGAPRIELADGHCRLVADVRIPSRRTGGQDSLALFLEVPCEYGDYLTVDRCDAFLVGLVHYALYHGLDVRCEAPVSVELHYHLTETLISGLTDKGCCPIQINADLAEGVLTNAEAVGTGISCGVDSMHAIRNHLGNPVKSLRLTHLAINNVGAFRPDSGQYRRSVTVARKVAEETGLKLVDSTSNISMVLDYPFEWCHTFMNSFVTLGLGKLYQKYFYGSSGYGCASWGMSGHYSLRHDCAFYECFLLPCFSNSSTRTKIVLDGATKNRFQKIRDIADFDLAQKYLNVCVSDTGVNCGRCEKCRRTLINLDGLGVLEKFSTVFDMDAYRCNKWKYLGWALYRKWVGRGDMTNDALETLRWQIGFKSSAFAMARLMTRPFKGI